MDQAGEYTHADQLVKANGLVESSTIAAILIGSEVPARVAR
jgi:LPLT family lysophospholipid transporter-like MFS transporter